MRLLPLLVVPLLLAVPLPVLADAGGDDAPQSAVDVAPGTHNGTIGQAGDRADWFRVEHPAGMGVQVTLTIANVGHYHLILLSDAGYYVADAHVTPAWPQNVSTTTVTLRGGGGGAVRVGIVDYDFAPVAANYTLGLAVVPLPDFAVTDVRVQNVAPLHTDLGEVYTGTKRRIEVDVANLGAANGSAILFLQATTPTDRVTTTIGGAWVPLGPGASTTRTFDWDATGIVGDVTIQASASAPDDADRLNDALLREHYVVVGGTGQGVTLLRPSSYTCAPAIVSSTCFWVGGGSGAYVGAFHAGPLHAAYLSAGTDGHHAQAGVAAVSYVGASAFAWRDVQHGGGQVSACASAVVAHRCTSTFLP